MLLSKKETISSLAAFSFMKLFELKSNFCDSSLKDALHVWNSPDIMCMQVCTTIDVVHIGSI